MTDNELALLGLLANGPRDEKQILGLIDSQRIRRWTMIGTSGINYLLIKLINQGLVQQQPRENTAPLYTLTQAGIGVLNTAINDLLNGTHPRERFFSLGLVHSHLLESNQVWRALMNRRSQLTSEAGHIEKMLVDQTGQIGIGAFQAEAMFSYRLHMLKSEIQWMDRFITEFEEQYPNAPFGTAPETPPLTLRDPKDEQVRQIMLPHHPNSTHKIETALHEQIVGKTGSGESLPDVSEAAVGAVSDTVPDESEVSGVVLPLSDPNKTPLGIATQRIRIPVETIRHVYKTESPESDSGSGDSDNSAQHGLKGDTPT